MSETMRERMRRLVGVPSGACQPVADEFVEATEPPPVVAPASTEWPVVVESAPSPAMSESRRAEIARLLENYWRWCYGDAGGGGQSMWSLMPRARRAAPVVPTISPDAERSLAALMRMEPLAAKVLVMEYCRGGTRASKAALLRVARVTYWRWVCAAEIAFWRHYCAVQTSAQRPVARESAEVAAGVYALALAREIAEPAPVMVEYYPVR